MPPIKQLMSRDDLWVAGQDKLTKHLTEENARLSGENPRWREVEGKMVPVLWPSSLGDCRKKITYDLLPDAVSEPFPNDVEIRLYDGQWHEKSMAHWLGIMGYPITDRDKKVRKIVRNKKGQPLFLLRGRLDGIIFKVPPPPDWLNEKEEVPDTTAIWEAKGLSTWTMKKQTPSDIVFPHYRDQGTLYMKMTGIHRCIFTVKNKDTGAFRFIEWFYSEARAMKLIRKGAEIARFAQIEKLAPRDHDSPKAFQCRWCRHKEKCW
jgi:hypothetical protein